MARHLAFLSHLPPLPCSALQESRSPHLQSSHTHLRLSCPYCLLQGLTEDEEQRRAARDVGDDVVPEPHKPQEAPIKEDAEQVVPVRLDSGKPKEEGMERAAKAAREDAQVGLGDSREGCIRWELFCVTSNESWSVRKLEEGAMEGPAKAARKGHRYARGPSTFVLLCGRCSDVCSMRLC